MVTIELSDKEWVVVLYALAFRVDTLRTRGASTNWTMLFEDVHKEILDAFAGGDEEGGGTD